VAAVYTAVARETISKPSSAVTAPTSAAVSTVLLRAQQIRSTRSRGRTEPRRTAGWAHQHRDASSSTSPSQCRQARLGCRRANRQDRPPIQATATERATCAPWLSAIRSIAVAGCLGPRPAETVPSRSRGSRRPARE
jgi:hypothetical protein